MSNLAFFDTNVLVYSDDASSPAKRTRAIALLTNHMRDNTAVISLQVLQEYYVIATGKLGVDPELAQRKVELLTRTRVVSPSTSDVITAIELHRLRKISFWDAMIVQAARVAGAPVLYSEDLQPGSVLAGVRIENPFVTR